MLTADAPRALRKAVELLRIVAEDEANDVEIRTEAAEAAEAVEELYRSNRTLGSLTRRALRRLDAGQTTKVREDLLYAVNNHAKPNILR